MSKSLYTFATSLRPDPYINALAYAVQHQGVKAYNVVVITETEYNHDDEEEVAEFATTVVSKITNQLSELSEGRYIATDKSGDQKLEELTNTKGITVYKECLETINREGATAIIIPLSELDSRLRKFASKGNCIFDVSALKKESFDRCCCDSFVYSFF